MVTVSPPLAIGATRSAVSRRSWSTCRPAGVRPVTITGLASRSSPPWNGSAGRDPSPARARSDPGSGFPRRRPESRRRRRSPRRATTGGVPAATRAPMSAGCTTRPARRGAVEPRAGGRCASTRAGGDRHRAVTPGGRAWRRRMPLSHRS
jgi:hypothetical protein